jgi:hypothetical protein
VLFFSLLIATTSIIGTSYSIEKNSTSNINNITIPAVCDDEKCLPQLFVTLPINQTQITNTSEKDLTNLKEKYLQDFGKYLDSSFNMIKSHGVGPIKPMNFCDMLPPPGCFGITPEIRQIDIEK